MLAIYRSWVVVNLLFICIVVPCDACNFQDGRRVFTKVTIYIYSCAKCLCHVQGGSWVLAIYIYSCAICFMSKMAAGCLLFIFIVVSGVLSCVQDGSWAVGSRYLYL